jgi:nucleoside 2-deoxyribosyltransferase
MQRLYLAGPDVFLPDAAAVGRAKQAACARHGLAGVFPLDGERPGEAPSGPEAGFAIAAANEAKMLSCDAIIANLSPFRGAPLGRLADGRLVGADGLTAESFGLSDNLMLHAAVGLDGLVIVPEPGLAAMEAFERCVALAAQALAGNLRRPAD